MTPKFHEFAASALPLKGSHQHCLWEVKNEWEIFQVLSSRDSAWFLSLAKFKSATYILFAPTKNTARFKGRLHERNTIREAARR